MTPGEQRATREEMLRCARKCALAMIETAEYLGTVLPQVRIEEPALSHIALILPELDSIGRKLFQVVSLSRTLRLAPISIVDQQILIAEALEQVSEVMLRMNRIVMTLPRAAEQDAELGEAFVLLAGSTMKILNPFERTREAARGLFGTDPIANG
jgi:hypothetical protein